jgi:hypothetical protein
MTQLSGPRRLGAYEDRRLDCQLSLEPIFDNITRLALHCGWTEDDIAFALLELARANIKGLMHDRVTAGEIDVAKQMAKAPRGDM